MNRDKDEFWAITDPDGDLLAGTCRTRAEVIGSFVGGLVIVGGRFAITATAQRAWQEAYGQGYRARRVRVEVI